VLHEGHAARQSGIRTARNCVIRQGMVWFENSAHTVFEEEPGETPLHLVQIASDEPFIRGKELSTADSGSPSHEDVPTSVDPMRCNSVPTGETPTQIAPEQQRDCAHLGHAENASRQEQSVLIRIPCLFRSAATLWVNPALRFPSDWNCFRVLLDSYIALLH
jgi:hypothetical protein